jgi:tRNA 2-thiouridine synthesizing protein E
MEKVIAGQTVEVDEQGYMTKPDQWTEAVGEAIAGELGITLTDAHRKVIDFVRAEAAKGEELTIRKVGTSGIVDIKTLYELFPGGPLKNACKIAGLPKPKSCL